MNDPLRIAIVHPFSWPSVRRGGERYLADLTSYLTGAGHDVDVVTGSSNGRPAPGPRIVAVRVRESRWLARRGIGAVELFGASAFPRLASRRYDVVHALTPSAAIAARMARHRTVYTVLGHPDPELVRGFPAVQRALLGRAVRSADVVAALSAPSARAAEGSFGRRADVLPPGVWLDRFPLDPRPRTGPVRILFPAFASNPHKGLGTLVEAFMLLRRKEGDARLVLAGPGDPGWALDRCDAETRAAIERPGVGPVESLPATYATATVTVLPSLYEAFGLVLVESLACGTPVVCASTSGGSTDIVDQPDIGRAAPFGDPGALARALEEAIGLARDPLTPQRCHEHAGRWDWATSVGPAHEAVYGRVVSGAARAAKRIEER